MDNSVTGDDDSAKIIFKKRKVKGNVKKVTNVNADKEENDEDNSIDWSTLDELRELRKVKQRRTKGIDVMDLLNDTNKKTEEKIGDKVVGGLTDSKTLANELDLGNTFSLETNRRDEDTELMRYVEEELAKRRSNELNENGNNNDNLSNGSSIRDLLIKSMPEHLIKLIDETKSKNEEMLSLQMLSGIPEIDLGIEERIRNIEKTETARTKLLEKRILSEEDKSTNNNKDLSFAPKNLASCFKNRNLLANNQNLNHRFNLNSIPNESKDLINMFNNKEDRRSNKNENQRPVIQYDIEPVVVIGDEPQKVRLPKPIDKDKWVPAKDKPMDNYMFEKFKKQLKKR